MGKLNEEHKNYIKTNIKMSNQKIADNLLSEFNLKISKEGVRKYKISCQQPKKVVKVPTAQKPRIQTPRKYTPKPESTFKYPEGIDDLIKLLDSMKDHYWHDYIYKQATGKLRSDFQKLFEIIRDAKRDNKSLVRT